jgi:hypothetical protein
MCTTLQAKLRTHYPFSNARRFPMSLHESHSMNRISHRSTKKGVTVRFFLPDSWIRWPLEKIKTNTPTSDTTLVVFIVGIDFFHPYSLTQNKKNSLRCLRCETVGVLHEMLNDYHPFIYGERGTAGNERSPEPLQGIDPAPLRPSCSRPSWTCAA